LARASVYAATYTSSTWKGYHMKFTMIAAGLIASFSMAGAAQAADLWALSGSNKLAKIDTVAKKVTGTWDIKNVKTSLRGIDVRPSNGKLYAVGDDNVLYTIDPSTATATAGAKLNQALPGKGSAVVDFNPVADRLRLIAADGTNFRVNVDTGEVVLDKALNYAADGAYAGKTPKVVAGAYTNSYAGTKATQLFDLDAATGQLLLQAPPNDGTLVAKGEIVKKLSKPAFDIVSDGKGGNQAYLLLDGALHTVDLETGKPTLVGKISGLPKGVIDLAAPGAM